MKYWIWAIVPGLLATPARAANKCVETSGRIFYQAAPCPPNTHGGDLRWLERQPPLDRPVQPPRGGRRPHDHDRRRPRGPAHRAGAGHGFAQGRSAVAWNSAPAYRNIHPVAG